MNPESDTETRLTLKEEILRSSKQTLIEENLDSSYEVDEEKLDQIV
jgi:hypothetical protein